LGIRIYANAAGESEYESAQPAALELLIYGSQQGTHHMLKTVLASLMGAAFLLGSVPARADPAVQFGTGASSVGIYCSNAGGTAWVACGTTANPLVTSGGGGGGGGSVTQGTVPWIVAGQGTAGTAAAAVLTIQGIASMTPVLGQLVAGSAVIGHVIVDSGTLTAVTAITNALPAGTNILGKVGVDQTTPGSTNGAAIVGVNAATALAGAGATGTGSLRVTAAQDTTTIAGSAPGTAGTASANVVTVQGVASMTKLLVTPDSVALPANQSVNVAQVNGITTLTGAGATGTGSLRVTAAQDTTTIAGSAPGTAGTPSTNVVSIQGVSSGTVVPVSGTVTNNNAVNVTPTDCSGTVTTGGTAQNAFTAQTTLHGFTIVNIDTTEVLWISFTTTAAASGSGSYPLQAATATTFAGAGSFTAPPGFGLNHALSVIATTTSHKFTCTWW
jgi:hypothetical protein